MNVNVDVGNTTIRIGLYNDNCLVDTFCFTKNLSKTSDEYVLLFKEALKAKNIDIDDQVYILYSSVVPNLDSTLISSLKQVFKTEKLLTIGVGIKTGLMLKVDSPNEIGGDLIADLIGGKHKYGYPLIVIDLGTASKILFIDKDGAFSSALFFPGIGLSLNTLSNSTALLPTISFETPKSVLAKNTVEAMKAGITYGTVDMIVGLCKRIQDSVGYSTKAVVTGGLAKKIMHLFPETFIFDEHLNLDGMNVILRKNIGNL